MIDKKGNIITQNEILKKYYYILKENTAQIAIIIPISVAIYGAVSNYYFYIVNRGYYKYFGIDAELMLPYNKINLYQNIGRWTLLALYWGYTIFSVRMFLLKRNFCGKVIWLIVFPLLINAWMSGERELSLAVIVASVILLPFQWLMIYSLGYCMVISFHKETLLEPKRTKSKNKRIKRWGDKEYRSLGMMITLMMCIIVFWQRYNDSYITASEKTRFGIVEIDKEDYAVIDANENRMILQKCEIENEKLIIYINTYLCTTNDIVINFKNFTNVERK